MKKIRMGIFKLKNKIEIFDLGPSPTEKKEGPEGPPNEKA